MAALHPLSLFAHTPIENATVTVPVSFLKLGTVCTYAQWLEYKASDPPGLHISCLTRGQSIGVTVRIITKVSDTILLTLFKFTGLAGLISILSVLLLLGLIAVSYLTCI
jgi:hypothetical protein